MNYNSPITTTTGTTRITLGNAHLELVFDAAHHGALVGLLDKVSGADLIRERDAHKALFRLALCRQSDLEIEWLESGDAREFSWRIDEDAQSATLTMVLGAFPGCALTVEATVRLAHDSPMSAWHLVVRDVDDAAVHQLIFPLLTGLVKLGDPAPGESLAMPWFAEGYLFRNPFPVVDHLPLCFGAGPESPSVGVGGVSLEYPSSLAMQFLAWYNDAAGLYLATHDAEMHVKSFEIRPAPNTSRQEPAFWISHRMPQVFGGEYQLPYDVTIGVFHGDWYDAAEHYKAWAHRQWWCAQKLWERDIPEWMHRGFAVFQASNYHMPKLKLNHSLASIAETVNGLAAETGVPLLALIFNYEQGGAWTGPSGLLPPREGEEAFRTAMAQLRAAGNHGFVYIPGGVWYLKLPHDPPFDSWETFRREGQSSAVKDIYGQTPVMPLLPGWQMTVMCPGTTYLQETTIDMVRRCLALGCTAVQIDNFPICARENCYDPAHGHPPGYGNWSALAWDRLLAEARREAKAVNPECILSTESVVECFIPHIDLYDQRAANMEYFGRIFAGAPLGGETIPLFAYVYHQYVGAYTAAYPECNRPEVLYWTRCLGKSLAQGVVPTGGKYFPEPAELNPITIGFYKKIVRAAARECWPYLLFGEMLRAPKVEAPTITASYCKAVADFDHLDPQQRHEVQDYAIQSSAWRGRDGSVGYFFINISEDPVEFTAEFRAYDEEGPQARYDLDRMVDGVEEHWLTGVALPRTEQITLSPLSIMLVRAVSSK